jgi:signal transduction histidine kinase
VSRPTIAIISDVPEFSAAATRRWLAERNVPSFLFTESHSNAEFSDGNFDLAVVGGVQADALSSVLEILKPTGKPIIHVSKLNGSSPREVINIPEAPGWPDLLVTMANQVWSYERISGELNKAMEAKAQLEQHASLGRYMLEVRHNLNNALTSILGNADLMLLDSTAVAPAHRTQVETIRNMGLRVNEIMRRFSSLQKELQLVEESRKPARKAARVGQF